ncbi:hypothetical protein AB6A40_004759 [Gnathostoma spinigerum]|uniref:GH18 domain-containing protein n=1 Tax=Gnathostoma spinigerum TaxID=75299 RepID=A0ABD6EDG1_9BILA
MLRNREYAVFSGEEMATGFVTSFLIIIVLLFYYPISSTGATHCSFYCFTTPKENEKITTELYEQLPCTHFVYGYAHVTRENRLIPPTRFDLPSYTEQGNYRTFTRMKQWGGVKILLGVKQKGSPTFTDNKYSRVHFAELLIKTARKYNFDGLYLSFGGDYRSVLFQQFFETLAAKVKANAQRSEFGSRLFVVLAFPSTQAQSGLRNLHKLVDAVYLVTEDSESVSDPSTSRHLNPLLATNTIPVEDTVSGTALALVEDGEIPRKKIIIGLSIWARSYMMENPQNVGHGNAATDFGPSGNLTRRSDGRLSYPEICRVPDLKTRAAYDEQGIALSFTSNEGVWYSFELPRHRSLDTKLKWISSQEFGGVGLSSVQADDATNKCGEGRMPLHEFVGQKMKCADQLIRRNYNKCIRICHIRPEKVEDNFKVDSLEPQWCSHIVIAMVEFKDQQLMVSSKAKELLSEFRQWASHQQPHVLFSVGAESSSSEWRIQLESNASRYSLSMKLKDLMKEWEVDGVEVAWSAEAMTERSDRDALSSFLVQLRNILGKNALIVLTANPETALKRLYDITLIQRNCDYVILEGHSFWRHNSSTAGHFSIMFKDHPDLPDRTMTLESIATDWLSLLNNRSKLILGLSAEGHIQMLADNSHGDVRLYSTRTTGDTDKDSISQSEVVF